MADIFDTSTLDENTISLLNSDEASWIYNGLDCCVTAEIYNALTVQLEGEPQNVKDTYAFTMSKHAPIFEMGLRGTLINENARQQTIIELEKELEELDKKFQRMMAEIFNSSMNWRSPLQLKNFFYGVLGLKEIRKRAADGRYVATVNREALEHFQIYLYARPFANFILVMRDIHKQLGFLKTEIDSDGRMRTSYNIAGTNTGRLSSAMNDFGTGTNLQNVNRKLRYPFVADRGKYLLNIDLEQADGRNVGAICHELFYESHGPAFASSYLDACESGDLHTTVCHMVWPELAWPEDHKEWKKFCDGMIAHGQDSYRQLAKKGGHGTNYYGTPRTMAKHLHTATPVIEKFQAAYFSAFPCVRAWHEWVKEELIRSSTITTLFGRRRMFFGRPSELSTIRAAIAYAPQSMTGEEIDHALYALWKNFPEVELLNQVHDSILLQIPFARINELVPKILEAMKVVLKLKGGRDFFVPLEAAGGWNWGYFDRDNPASNPYGLIKWKGEETRNPPAYVSRKQKPTKFADRLNETRLD